MAVSCLEDEKAVGRKAFAHASMWRVPICSSVPLARVATVSNFSSALLSSGGLFGFEVTR